MYLLRFFFFKKGFKYFICYKGAKRTRPLRIFLPEVGAYRRDFDESKYMSFLIKDDELSEKYNEIWEKAEISIKKNNGKLAYNEKYSKAKRISYNGKVFTKIKYQKKVLNLFAY